MVRFTRFVLAVACLMVFASGAFADWTKYKSNDFGFEMLVPPGAQGAAKDYDNGWAGLYFNAAPSTNVWAIAKMGVWDSKDDVREFAILASEIPLEYWDEIPGGSAKNVDGFKWIESYIAKSGKDMVIAVIGTGPRGSYVVFVTTTEAEYAAGEADFDKFFGSIRVV